MVVAVVNADTQPETQSPSLELRLPARAQSVTIVRQALSGLAEARGWADELVEDMKIALSEACSNVVVHAYPDGAAGDMTIAAWPSDDQVVFTVTDHGSGVAPTLPAERVGLGLGLPLMAALSHEMQMRSGPGQATEVRLTFLMVPAAHADQRA